MLFFNCFYSIGRGLGLGASPPSFSAQVPWGEYGAPVQSLSSSVSYRNQPSSPTMCCCCSFRVFRGEHDACFGSLGRFSSIAAVCSKNELADFAAPETTHQQQQKKEKDWI